MCIREGDFYFRECGINYFHHVPCILIPGCAALAIRKNYSGSGVLRCKYQQHRVVLIQQRGERNIRRGVTEIKHVVLIYRYVMCY